MARLQDKYDIKIRGIDDAARKIDNKKPKNGKKLKEQAQAIDLVD
eukprot:CAMPEP_0168621916 /NCGR_PEP_ID=MMETSP0449_2-20121227/7968_1 /TAXON_ID=1082188 /ORGANISM="Strombidium rassoulzadegani, Strain ras09" /LENGTH=44 /DNA_ID= /DNA_START= /DNA_END= /DNA_ORIENTATION=